MIVKKNIATIIELPRIPDARGNLSFIESENQIPFSIQRVFYLYDVPGGESRAGHALQTCHQLIVAISGSFDVTLDDGYNTFKYHLNRPFFGLHVHPRVWRVLDNFSSGAVCLVLASEVYDSDGYFREYDKFRSFMRQDKP
jgi:hypothetical protein